MLGPYFYNRIFAKAIIGFGTLFKEIYVMRKDRDGQINQIRVPIMYAPQRKFIAEITGRKKFKDAKVQKIATTLPRMSYEILGLNHDRDRQMVKTTRLDVTIPGGDGTKKAKIYAKTPYNMQFLLNIAVKHQEEAFQIVEQILINFAPQYTITAKPVEGYPEIEDDWPISLNGPSFLDDNEGAFEKRRVIVFTIDFEMKMNFWQAVRATSVIKKAMIDLGTISEDSIYEVLNEIRVGEEDEAT